MLYLSRHRRRVLFHLFLISWLGLNSPAWGDWKEDWAKTQQAAEQEGRVVIYSYPGLQKFFAAFEKKFPKINLIEVSVRGSGRIQRILAERRAGRYLADIAIGGAGSGYVGLYQTRVLDPIKTVLMLPEVTDESQWWGGKHIYSDDEQMFILAFGPQSARQL